MTLSRAFGMYMVSFATFVFLVWLAVKIKWFPGAIPFFGYFGSGFLLNRVVLRNLIEWHPMYNTLYNVSSAKLWYLLVWPIAYAGLFFRLMVTKHL